MQLSSFDEFKNWAAENIISRMPAGYENAEVKLHEVKKMGRCYTGLTVSKKGQSVAATVDLDEMYSVYKNGAPKEDVLSVMAKIAVMVPPMPLDDTIGLSSYETVKGRLFARLSSFQAGSGLLEKLPHRIIGDMVLTYHVVSGSTSRDLWSVMISRELLDELGVPEEQLHEDTLNNSAAIFPAKLLSLGSIAAKSSGTEYKKPEGPEIMVLTNSTNVYGASAVLYPGVLEMVRQEMGEDFYIVPSSVNEVLLVPESLVADPAELLRTHRFVSSQTEPDERLSDLIFRADPESGRLISAASDPVS